MSSPNPVPTPAPATTANPLLKAAAPTLVVALQNMQQMITTIITGDPMQAPARVVPAAEIFLAQLVLQLPGLAGSELLAGGADLNAKIGNVITKLKAL
jgi:hypothetical protein